MTSGYLVQRRREVRLHRFGLALGGALALLFHLVLFWGPRVAYRPVLELARVRRVLVARPYHPVAAPAPVPAQPRPTRRAKAGEVPKPTPTPTRKAKAGPVQPPPAQAAPQPRTPQPAAGADVERSVARVAETAPDALRARPKGEADATRTPAPPAARDDAWSAVLASLQGRKTDIQDKWQERKAEIEAQSAGVTPAETHWGGGGKDADGEGYLDSRIRMTVVSYPPTSIEADYPAISYPELRFRRAQLQKGTCRVWYRVWLDGNGAIVRTQLKTPATEAERKLYAEFIAQVEQSVAEWPFPRQEAEVHVDVFFQIE